MRVLFAIAMSLAFCFPAHAGIQICSDLAGNVTSARLRANPKDGCIYVNDDTPAEYSRVKDLLTTEPVKFLEVDSGQMVKRPQPEIDQIIANEAAAAAAAEAARADKLEVELKDALVAFIKVYNSKVPAQYRVTKKEIVDQIKVDKGL